MRADTSLAVLVAAAALAMQPAFVPGGANSSEGQLQERVSLQRDAARVLAHKMMGHINLASVALDLRLPGAAQEQVKKAESLASQLRNSAPELEAELRLKYGKISYTVDGQSKNYYVPILDDLFLVSDYQSIFRAWKNSADITEADAGVVLLTLSVDIHMLEEALQDAGGRIGARRYREASEALAEIFNSAFVDEIAFSNPVWAVHDNLAFARKLIEEGRYDSARYVLQHAQEELEQVKKHYTGQTESESLQEMSAQIAKLEKKLEQEHPSVMELVSDTLAAWRDTVESLFLSE